MKRSEFSEESVVYALRQVEAGSPIGDICRQLGVSELCHLRYGNQRRTSILYRTGILKGLREKGQGGGTR